MGRRSEGECGTASADLRLDASQGASAGTWSGPSRNDIPPRCWIGRDLPPIHVDGEECFLVSWKGEMFLVPNRCPHRGGPLKFGYVNAADEIVCPMHHNAFPIERLIAGRNARRLKVEPK